MATAIDVFPHDKYVGLCDADLLDGGTRHPNLVLLKIAGFLHDNHVPFDLILDSKADISKYEHIFLSRVFTYTKLPEFYINAIGTDSVAKFHIGGTGFYANETSFANYKEKRNLDLSSLENDQYLNTLDNYHGGNKSKGIDMASQMPYYRLYDIFVERQTAAGFKRNKYKDYQKYSIGFLTRGCIRHCPFCINKLENKVHRYSKLEWFLDDERDERGRLVRPYIYLWDDNFLAADRAIWEPLLKELIDESTIKSGF